MITRDDSKILPKYPEIHPKYDLRDFFHEMAILPSFQNGIFHDGFEKSRNLSQL